MSEFNEQDFKTTLLNKAEIEQALGITINLNKSNDGWHLEDYAMYEHLSLHTVVCIFLGMHPENINAHQHHRYEVIYNAVSYAVRNNALPAKVEQDYDINGNEIQYDIYLSHDTARQWAKTHGLLWNIPPYKAVEINTKTADNSELIQQLTAKDEEIARLNAEIAELKKASPQPQIVDYEQYSIYGHSSELLKIVFEVTKEFWANAETPPKNAAIEAWISENYPQKRYAFVSQTVRQYIATILRPQPKLK